jgi:Tol biopolymer transport system component
MNLVRTSCRCVVALLLIALGVERASSVQLNSPLVVGGNVATEFEFTPDGSHVVYVADQDLYSVREMFRVPSGGGEAVPISGSLAAGGDVVVGSGRFNASGSHRFFVADGETDEQFELFCVAMGDASPAKISGELVFFGDVDADFRIGADGSRVLYVANAETNSFGDVIWELFSVDAGGGEPVKLNGPLPSGGDVLAGSARFNAAGTRAFYLADQNLSDRVELYSVDSAGGESVKLSGTLAFGSVDARYHVSPNAARAVYVATQSLDPFGGSVVEIFSVPANGGPVTTLNGPMVSGGDVVPGSGRISPDSSRVLFVADKLTDEVEELFSVPLAGGTPQRLNGTMQPTGDVLVDSLQFSLDSSRVLYVADQNIENQHELFTVPATGGTAIRLNAPLTSQGDVVVSSVAFSPDGGRVIYRADQNTDEKFELFSVAAGGGTPMLLNTALPTSGDVIDARFSPDGASVFYLANQEFGNVFELFQVPAAGGEPQKINGPLVPGGNVTHWAVSPAGDRVVYRADQDQDEVFELFSVALVDSPTLSGDFNNDGIVDAVDYTVWRNNLGEATEADIHHAGNGTAGVDSGDYNVWKQHYGDETPFVGAGALVARVPEPTAICPLLVGALLWMQIRSRRTKLGWP